MQYLPGWRVEIQAYSMGIRGSHDLGRWKEQLSGLGVSERRISNLIRDMVALTLGELTELYSIRYAALQNAPSPLGDEPLGTVSPNRRRTYRGKKHMYCW